MPTNFVEPHAREDFTLLQEAMTNAAILTRADAVRTLGVSVYASSNNRLRLHATAVSRGRVSMSGRLNNATDTFTTTLQANLGASIPRVRAALAVSSTGFARGCVNGGAVVSSPQAGAIIGVPTLYLGTYVGQSSQTELPLDGHIQRIAIYPGALSNIQLQRLTQA